MTCRETARKLRISTSIVYHLSSKERLCPTYGSRWRKYTNSIIELYENQTASPAGIAKLLCIPYSVVYFVLNKHKEGCFRKHARSVARKREPKTKFAEINLAIKAKKDTNGSGVKGIDVIKPSDNYSIYWKK
ncbi:MAG: hypothetical protein ACRCZM_11850 [Bacteroidales bacterium]